jgi:hypothetical protein
MGASGEAGSGHERVPKAKTPMTNRAARRVKTRNRHLDAMEGWFLSP